MGLAGFVRVAVQPSGIATCNHACSGRRPYYTGLGLDSVGVDLDKRGRIKVSRMPHPASLLCASECQSAKCQVLMLSDKLITGSAQVVWGVLPDPVQDVEGCEYSYCEEPGLLLGLEQAPSGIGARRQLTLNAKEWIEQDGLADSQVDDKFATTAPSGNIYAIGDVIDGPMLAHKVQ